jgi:hypothetical protein
MRTMRMFLALLATQRLLPFGSQLRRSRYHCGFLKCRRTSQDDSRHRKRASKMIFGPRRHGIEKSRPRDRPAPPRTIQLTASGTPG